MKILTLFIFPKPTPTDEKEQLSAGTSTKALKH